MRQASLARAVRSLDLQEILGCPRPEGSPTVNARDWLHHEMPVRQTPPNFRKLPKNGWKMVWIHVRGNIRADDSSG